MTKTFSTEFAIRTEGRCDLTGLPCLHAVNLARQMARVFAQLGEALPEAFGLEADVEISGCLRPCRLSVVVGDARVAVGHGGQPLASVDLPDMSMVGGRAGTAPAMSAIGWHAH